MLQLLLHQLSELERDSKNSYPNFAVSWPVILAYVLLTTFTQKASRMSDRARIERPTRGNWLNHLGGTWREFVVTTDRSDRVIIADVPDDEITVLENLTPPESGDVTTGTLRAVSLDEFRDIVDAKPR